MMDMEEAREALAVEAEAMACTGCGGGPFVFLGQLGATPWVRCRACGWDQPLAADGQGGT